MVAEKDVIAPTEHELAQFDLNSPDIVELIHHAEQGDAADRLLTVRQALGKYKKAVFWAMFLSTSLIMEGYDMSMVSPYRFHRRLRPLWSPSL
jgi:SP family general alpha glucoside:H+ symporter-like MFS transporter